MPEATGETNGTIRSVALDERVSVPRPCFIFGAFLGGTCPAGFGSGFWRILTLPRPDFGPDFGPEFGMSGVIVVRVAGF